jgi:hypothetical protein
MQILKLFIPSWQFFTGSSASAHLFYKVDTSGWLPAIVKPQRSWIHVFFNPDGNLYLAKQSAVDQLVNEINSLNKVDDSIQESLSYQIVLNIAREAARQKAPSGRLYFKIQVRSPNEVYDAIISSELEF